MTPEEARGQFPVLERVAYLNAGSAGPLPQATVDAMRFRLERDLAAGRSTKTYMEDVFALRERIRAALAAILGTSAELVALTDSTTRGCQIVLAGLGLGAGDEVVDHRPGALRPDRSTPRQRRPRPRDGGRRGRAPRRGDTAHPADRRLARPLDDGTQARRRAAPTPDGPPLLVDGAQSAGAIPVDLDGADLDADFYTVSAPEVALWAGSVGRAVRARSGAAGRRAADRVLAADA